MDEFFVTTSGAYASVRTAEPEVRALLQREIGDFFRIESSTDAPLCLGRVVAYLDTYQGELAGDARDVLLHDGLHDYDLRRGRLYRDAAGRRLIDSYDTKSILLVDDEAREIAVYNPDAKTLAVDVRRTVRDQLYVPWFESQGAVTYHASAFRLGSAGFIAAGNRGAGKTSIFMAALCASGTKAFLSCERTIVVPKDDAFVMHACPENISIFPGTYLQFPQSAPLAPDVPPELRWERAQKRRVTWRRLFEAFGAEPDPTMPRLSVLLFPKYDGSAQGVSVSVLDPADTAARLLENQVTLRDRNRPNWLGWYVERGTAESAQRVAQLPGLALTWPDVESVVRWFNEEAEQYAVPTGHAR